MDESWLPSMVDRVVEDGATYRREFWGVIMDTDEGVVMPRFELIAEPEIVEQTCQCGALHVHYLSGSQRVVRLVSHSEDGSPVMLSIPRGLCHIDCIHCGHECYIVNRRFVEWSRGDVSRDSRPTGAAAVRGESVVFGPETTETCEIEPTEGGQPPEQWPEMASYLRSDELAYLAKSPRCQTCEHLGVFHSDDDDDPGCGIEDCECPRWLFLQWPAPEES